MKNNPIVVVLIGSILLSVLVGVSMIFIHLIDPLPIWAFIVFPIGISAGAFLVFYVLFKKFIHNRLKILYRSIRKGKMHEGDAFDMSMTNDIIGEAEKETKLWAEEKQTEIVQLKEQDKDWGDIFICVPQIKRQAKEYGVTYTEELIRMTVHGVLHLLGFDHEKEEDANIMFSLQDRLVLACMKK